jgi:AcrR family transcriptional regulator
MPGTRESSTSGSRRPRADAARNRAALAAAARRVFERDGFVAARITDIADEAGLAHGSFYSHFRTKEDALAAVLAEIAGEMLHPGPELPDARDPAAAIEAANLAYLQAYQRNAALMVVLEQLASVDKDFLSLRLERSRAFIERNAGFIRRLQHDGLADRGLDPELAALALSVMVSRSAYAVLAVGLCEADPTALAATVTRLWLNGLQVPQQAGRGPAASRADEARPTQPSE